MNSETFVPTLEQQQNISMAYLAYSGEKLISKLDPAIVQVEILKIINNTLPKIPEIKRSGALDWKVVWGPTIYTFDLAILQDNMMFVAQQISNPSNYIVAVRGTNGTAMLDWIEEDFEVWSKVPWRFPSSIGFVGNPHISKGTHIGIDALLHKMSPLSSAIPGYPDNITSFLQKIAEKGKVNISFTGHSLGGALAPTLALWFRQDQHIAGGWDLSGNATISTVPFAGATAGDGDFAKLFNLLIGSNCQRFHCNQDVVPHAWVTSDLELLPDLYQSAGIKMPEYLKPFLDFVEANVKGYQQVDTSHSFDWPINLTYGTYFSQAGYQHVDSYPHYLGLPELNTVINNGSFRLPKNRRI